LVLLVYEINGGEAMRLNGGFVSLLDVHELPYCMRIVLALERGALGFNTLWRSVGSSPNTLTSRLGALQHLGLVRRVEIRQMPPAVEYRLRDKGRGLAEKLRAIEEWERTF